MSNVYLTAHAELVCIGDHVLLKFGNRHYTRDEIIPDTIYGPSNTSGDILRPTTAADFVIERMMKAHRDGGIWPERARTFLWPEKVTGTSPTTLPAAR